MKHFTVYDTTTGAIKRIGYCQEETLDLQAANPGEGVIEGQGNAATQKVDPDTKQLVAIS